MDQLRATVERALGNQYDVLQLIGRGGMGAVYLARERFLERMVAVKVLPHDSATDGSGRERFLREARTAARLSHPSIVPLHTFAEAEGTLLYVMGYIDGESLAAVLAREGRLPAERATRIVAEIADALNYAHSMGVVHRDVKPDNILIDGETGRAYLTDFGIAKQGAQEPLTRTGMVVGTPHYMSPEQGSGDPTIDGRSDLYSLGVIGYQMVSGRLPFESAGFHELLMQHATREPPPLDPTRDMAQLNDVVMRCLGKAPATRWQNGAQIVEALRQRDPSELNLPDELSGQPSGGVILLIAMILGEIGLWLTHRYLPDTTDWTPMVLMPVVSIAALTVMYAVQSRRHKMPWRELVKISFWPPSWWSSWWPNSLRRPGDVWNRLPKTVRRVRSMLTVALAIMLGVNLPVLAMVVTRWSRGDVAGAKVMDRINLGISAVGFGVFFAALAITVPWRKRFNLSNLVSKKLLGERTWNNPFWRRPEIAAILEPVGPVRASATAESPSEFVAAIDRAVAAMPEPLRLAGQQAAQTAREVLTFIEGVDREMVGLARDADPAERVRLERRLAQLVAQSPQRRSPMRELVDQQLALFTQLDARRVKLAAERQRSVDMLRRLLLQLANSRAQLGAGGVSVTELSGQIRAVCADLDRNRSAAVEVEHMLGPTMTDSVG